MFWPRAVFITYIITKTFYQKVQKKPKLLKQSYINYAELASFDKLTLFFWGGFNLEYGDLESGHLESRKWLSRI